MTTTAVLIMAYGTPASTGDVQDYYTHIRRGRAPSDDQVADLLRRYEAIGGVSPLRARTAAQTRAIATALGPAFETHTGFKHAPPFIEDACAAICASGAGSVVGLVLAPHYSAASVGQYHDRATAALAGSGLPYRRIDSWWDEPAFVDFCARGLRSTLEPMPEATKVLFTAHSLPERVLQDDPYPREVEASAAAVATRAGLGPWADWSQVWQSAGATPEPWRGPDILTVIDDLGGTGRARGVAVCPVGFVADHLEVLYDLDVEARARATDAGLAFARTPVVNDDHDVMVALAARVRSAVEGA